MERRLSILVLGICVSGFLSLCPGGEVSADATTLKAVTAWPKTASEYKAFATFVEKVDQLVSKQAPGELRIQYIGGPEAVKTPDQVQAAQRGMVDLVFTTTAYYVSVLPEVDAIKLSDYKPSEERASGAWTLINELHKKKDLFYLGRLGLGIRFHLYLKKPIMSADLRGLNIRVSPMYLQVVKGLGGNPVVIPPTEVFAALERNVVDGYCWPSVGIRDWGWQKHTKYVVEPGFYQVPNPLLANLQAWNRLPKRLQDLLLEAAVEAEKKVVADFEALAQAERPLLLKEGIQVIDLSPEEKAKFLRVAYEGGWKDVLAKSPQTGAQLREALTKKR